MIRRVQPRSTRHAEGDHLQRADASPSALAGDLNVYPGPALSRKMRVTGSTHFTGLKLRSINASAEHHLEQLHIRNEQTGPHFKM